MQALPIDGILESLRIGVGFLWTAAWAIIMGLVITSLVQVYVSKERMASVLGEGTSPASRERRRSARRAAAVASVLQPSAKGCSKGAHAVNFPRLHVRVDELDRRARPDDPDPPGGEFLLAELLGGLVLIAVMAVIVHLTLPETLFDEVRRTLEERDRESGTTEDPTCGMEGKTSIRSRPTGGDANVLFRGMHGDLPSANRESRRLVRGTPLVGRLVQGRQSVPQGVVDDLEGRYRGVSHLGIRHRVRPQRVWNALFLEGDGLLVTAENAVMGVAIAVISFVGSMGNVLFAVALWGGGISFAGVIAFVYADLITIPVLNVYRKYYGWRVMLYILGVFFVTMAFTGFLMELLFDALGIVPNLAGGETATDRTYFERNYTFYLNLIAFALRVPPVRLPPWSRRSRRVPRSSLWNADR